MQVCKYPEKAKRRKQALSSEDWVLSQIEKLQKQALRGEDEDQNDANEAETNSIDDWEDTGAYPDISGRGEGERLAIVQKPKSVNTNVAVRYPPANNEPAAATLKRSSSASSEYSIDLTKRPRVDYSSMSACFYTEQWSLMMISHQRSTSLCIGGIRCFEESVQSTFQGTLQRDTAESS